jgi:hypothetical protein
MLKGLDVASYSSFKAYVVPSQCSTRSIPVGYTRRPLGVAFGDGRKRTVPGAKGRSDIVSVLDSLLTNLAAFMLSNVLAEAKRYNWRGGSVILIAAVVK